MRAAILSLVLALLCFVGVTLSEDDNVFVATEEWQEIRPGQKVGAGLHYRMNLETGKKEAKLLDPDDVDAEHRVVATRKDDEGEEPTISDEDVKAVREKMAKFKLSKDIEQIKFLMANFHNATTAESKLAILDDLDFYMHQIDNARDFVTLGGFETLVEPALRSQDDDNVTAAATVLLGSAVQSNEPVRRHATDSGAIIQALTANLARTGQVASKTIFALSALLRDNPEGVAAFVKGGGLERLVTDVLVTSDSSDGSASSDVRAKIKCLSFVSQLWSDNTDAVVPGEEFCLVFDDPGLFGLEADPPAPAAAFDLGRTEVLSEVVSRFDQKCDLGSRSLVRRWLDRARQEIQQEIDDEDEDKDFLEYLQKIMDNIVSVSGGGKSEL